MSGIPQEIPDFGSAQLTPRQNPRFTPGPTFTTEDYFVWSRVDGRTSLRDIILMLGFGAERAIEILRRLRRSGAVLLPGEDPDSVAVAPPPPAAAPAARDSDEPPPAPDALGPLSPAEQRAMAEPVQLQASEKRRIIEMMRVVEAGDYFAVLGVPRDVDRRELKRAYFRVSKEFHPDRHYGHALGSFGPWLSRIFETATRAFQVLSDPARRAEHLATLDGGGARAASGARGSGGQNRAEHAAELFQRACDAEVSGDREGALRLFAAAVRVSPSARYLRRAARCALASGRLSEAEEYAKKAASLRSDDASYARVLADVYRAARKLAEAEEILIRALELPSASDILVREIQSDLAAVRAARAAE
ncbi:MAG TPA: J domain-containing protein [Kofleriaceae bacterium]|nr:J domain-containing protein [Kofleriaceae bacterium]